MAASDLMIVRLSWKLDLGAEGDKVLCRESVRS